MEAKELRIGNWVEVNPDGGWYENKFDIVDFVHMQKISFQRILGIKTSIKSSVIKVRGIPLTGEWLVKFGFVKDGKYYCLSFTDIDYCFLYRDWADNYALYVEYTDSPDVRDNGKKYPISFTTKYVHQLQNLYFALTGEELIIKL